MATYETDFAAWADAQASALRTRSANELDWNHLAEEIEALGARDRREIRTRVQRVCEHLLKLQFLPDLDPRRGWRASVIEQRRQIALLVEESPSLAQHPGAVLADAYHDALAPLRETYSAAFPDDCPWTVDEVLDPAFMPLP